MYSFSSVVDQFSETNHKLGYGKVIAVGRVRDSGGQRVVNLEDDGAVRLRISDPRHALVAGRVVRSDHDAVGLAIGDRELEKATRRRPPTG